MSSKTFTPLCQLNTHSLTFPEIWDHNATHSPDHPIFTYRGEDARDGERVITWGEASKAMHLAGRIILQAMKSDEDTIPASTTEPPVIAVLAVSDLVTSWATITGIVRNGFTALLLSPRNSPPALAHLLKNTKCRLVVHSSDKFVIDTLAQTFSMLGSSLPSCPLPGYSELYEHQDNVEPLPKPKNVHADNIALILHTSGSTSFPKPRFLTHRTCVQYGKYFRYEGIDVTGKVMAVHGLPHFHAMGVMSTIGWTSVSGMVMGVLPPNNPPIVATPQRVLNGAMSSRADALFVVPSVCEGWSSDGEDIKKLTQFKLVLYAGGPLNTRAGDILTSKGVKLRTLYGSTELGPVSAYPTDPLTKDWDYFKLARHLNTNLVREEGPEDVYELIATESSGLQPCVVNTDFEGKPAYATGDLFSPHPHDKELWRVVGRKDDQIMHSNGEKTSPGLMEDIINKHAAVSRSVMFGRGQFNTGIIIEPANGNISELTDESSRKAYIDEIWPTVEEANAQAPSYSRIFREMIILAKPEKPFKTTPKLTLRRSEIIKDYAEEISEAYHSLELSSSEDNITLPNSWSEGDCIGFTQATVTKVLGRDLSEDGDFFQNGLNSLQVVYVRNIITRALQQTNVDVSLEASAIYEHPTTASFGKFLADLIVGKGSSGSVAGHTEELTKLVERFSAHLPSHSGTLPRPEGESILVTGTTGSLGINALKALVSLDSVIKVYAYNRTNSAGGNARDRHVKAAELQGIAPSIVESPKIVYIEGDISLDNLGLATDVIAEMKRTVTSILHLAWKVDFNMAIASFVPHLQGIRNLIDLSLASDLECAPPIVFASSISDLQNFSGSEGEVIEAKIYPDPKTAVGIGYGESKWVASRVLEIAREKTPLNPVIVRIGQLCGSRETGAWNPWEWFPTIVRSAKAIGCLPELQGELSWIPVDTAASTMVDLRQNAEETPVANLVHPSPVFPQSILKPISECLNLPVKPYKEWLDRLRRIKSSSSGRPSVVGEVPALKLLDFYEAMTTDSKAGFMEMRLDVARTASMSNTFSDEVHHPLGGDDAVKWVHRWA